MNINYIRDVMALEKDIAAVSDYELIKMILNTDKNYFSELMRRYKNLVYSVVLRMVNDSEEANDLVQDIFVKIYKNLDRYYPDFKFSTWIMRIATNHVIDYRRKKRNETVSIDEIEYDIATDSSPETEFFERERSKLLNRLLGDLPDMYKIPIVLYHQQGLSYQEISDVIEEPLSKVKNRIFRGRRMLKDNLISLRGSESYGL